MCVLQFYEWANDRRRGAKLGDKFRETLGYKYTRNTKAKQNADVSSSQDSSEHLGCWHCQFLLESYIRLRGVKETSSPITNCVQVHLWPGFIRSWMPSDAVLWQFGYDGLGGSGSRHCETKWLLVETHSQDIKSNVRPMEGIATSLNLVKKETNILSLVIQTWDHRRSAELLITFVLIDQGIWRELPQLKWWVCVLQF